MSGINIPEKEGVAGDISIHRAKNLFLLILAFSLGLLFAFTEDFASVTVIACYIFEAYFYEFDGFLDVFGYFDVVFVCALFAIEAFFDGDVD